jgi:hypothetical protein
MDIFNVAIPGITHPAHSTLLSVTSAIQPLFSVTCCDMTAKARMVEHYEIILRQQYSKYVSAVTDDTTIEDIVFSIMRAS